MKSGGLRVGAPPRCHGSRQDLRRCLPTAKPIIHLGATSCYVGDNTDIIQMREGLLIIKKLLVNAISALGDFAEKYKDVPTLAYTHFQAAQPTTVGKRATLWAQDLILDLDNLDHVLSGS